MKTKEIIEEPRKNTAYFDISDGKRMLRVRAENDCWAICYWSDAIDKKTKEAVGWIPFKWVVDIGHAANRIFEFRLKSSDAKTLKELSEIAKKIRKDISKEFNL